MSAFSTRSRSGPSRSELPRSARGAAVSGENNATDCRGAARQHSHRNRRTDRTIGAASLPPTGIAVHHELSYPLSGIHFGALADSRTLDLGGAARLPRTEPGGDGSDAGAGQRVAGTRISQRGVMAARR